MKIGILTFHNSRNYGAVLQAYGLKESLKSLGHDVRILDYHNPQIANKKSPFAFKQFKSNPIKYVQRLINIYYGYRISVRNFKEFEKNNLEIYGHLLSTESVINSEFDYLVIGSDQVWSPIITGGPDPIYWGMNKPRYAKLITYAASSGDTALFENENYRDVSKWLNNFSAISVREERLKKYVEKHTNKEVMVVVDPTLLAGRDILEKITAPRIFKHPYILLYHVESSPTLLKIARHISKMYNAKIVSISPQNLYVQLRNKDIVYYNAKVPEMLSLIKYAECVVALSFHGTALSVIYEKDFYSVAGKNMARVESLLDKIGLKDRIIDDVDGIRGKKISWHEPNIKLQNIQNESFEWLKHSLI